MRTPRDEVISWAMQELLAVLEIQRGVLRLLL